MTPPVQPVVEPVIQNEPSTSDTLLQEALRATQEARISAENNALELQRQVADLNRRLSTPAPEAPLTQEQFFANPGAALEAAIARQIAPLQENARLIQRQMVYDRIKGQLAGHPQYGKWVTQFSSQLDNLFGNPNVEINAQNMVNTINVLIGQAVASNPSLLEAPPTPANNPPPVITPPHLRPSAPSSNSPSNAPAPRQFTENERRLMRENKMTEEEYTYYLTSGQRPGEKYVKPEAK